MPAYTSLLELNPIGATPCGISITLFEYLRPSQESHNHPSGSSLSFGDIATFLERELKEMRAICPDGSVFSLKYKGQPIPKIEIEDMMREIKRLMDTEYASLDKVNKERFKADWLMQQIKDKVDYVHYN